MGHRPLPSLETVASLFHYDADTGMLTPVTHRKNWIPGPKSGYATIRINEQRYNVSRVCWLLGTGKDPGTFEIDHINRDKFDNRLANLRLATRSQQLANRERTSASTLPKGVSFMAERNCYQAAWGKNGRKHTASGFATAEEAHLFYLWQTRHHGEFAELLPISACPPPPSARRRRRRKGTEDLPKGVSRVKRKNKDGGVYFDGYQTSYVNKEGRYTSKKGFTTPEEAHQYYLQNKR
jgi:hypothetical protein